VLTTSAGWRPTTGTNAFAVVKLDTADWLRRCAPWFSESEAEPLIEAALRNPIRWKADTLAARLNLTDAERSRLKIPQRWRGRLYEGTKSTAATRKKPPSERGQAPSGWNKTSVTIREPHRAVEGGRREPKDVVPATSTAARHNFNSSIRRGRCTTSSAVCSLLRYLRRTCAIAACRSAGGGTAAVGGASRSAAAPRPPCFY
jgi:hypothetical protein